MGRVIRVFVARNLIRTRVSLQERVRQFAHLRALGFVGRQQQAVVLEGSSRELVVDAPALAPILDQQTQFQSAFRVVVHQVCGLPDFLGDLAGGFGFQELREDRCVLKGSGGFRVGDDQFFFLHDFSLR